VKRALSSLAPGYSCVVTAPSFADAADLVASLCCSAAGTNGRLAEINALSGEPTAVDGLLVVNENETLGRTGRWLASSAWGRAPDVVVVGEALALGEPFGAVLVRDGFAVSASRVIRSAAPAALARVAAAIATVESEGLLRQGAEVADYLMARLQLMRDSCPQIASVDGTGLSIRITFAPPANESRSKNSGKNDRLKPGLLAAQIRRGMCERGVLVGVDGAGRLVVDPPLPLRIAEVDVITGALRGALLGLPTVSASACCAACRDDD